MKSLNIKSLFTKSLTQKFLIIKTLVEKLLALKSLFMKPQNFKPRTRKSVDLKFHFPLLAKSGLISALALFFLCFSGGCRKTIEITQQELPYWEDTSGDSVTLFVQIQNREGFYVYGQYVNMALSKDSLNRSLLVRKSVTDGTGRATFRRLFPGKYYINCFSSSSQSIGYISAKMVLFPEQIKDTLLILE